MKQKWRTGFGGRVIALLIAVTLLTVDAIAGLPGLTPSGGVATPMYLTTTWSRFGGMPHGVAFLRPADGDFLIVDIDYDGAARDGERLKLKVKTEGGALKNVVAPFYDWQLVPMTRVVNSDWDALVTLESCEGNGGDQSRRFEARIHPALLRTALGERLLQADLTLVSWDVAAGIPYSETVEANGTTIRLPHLEAGESMPGESLESRRRRAMELCGLAASAPDTAFNYTITDQVAPRATIVNGKVEIQGTPHWRFIGLDFTARPDFWRQLLTTMDHDADPTASESTVRRMFEDAPVEYLPTISCQISREMQISPPNQLVYEALESAMNASALLRMAQAQVPRQEWLAFVADIKDVKITLDDSLTPRFLNLQSDDSSE